MSDSGCIVCATILGLTILLILVLVPMSLKRVKDTELGVSYTPYSKILDDGAKGGGLYNGPPGFRFIKFPSTFITTELPQDTCVSRDGLRVDVRVVFQYQIEEDWVLPAILKYRNFEKWAKLVESAGISAIQHTCSEFFIPEYQKKRGEIQQRMEVNLRTKFEGEEEDGESGVYARAVSLQLRNIKIPEKYDNAVREKQAAAEDISLAQKERVQETTKAQTDLLTATEEAKIINNTAVNEVDIILTEAQIKVQEIAFQAAAEAELLSKARTTLSLTTAGLLAYLSNQLYERAPNLEVTAAEPASLSRRDEL